MKPFQLHRNPFGKLVFTGEDGTIHEGVVPVRAFPVAAPQEGLSLVDTDGRELLWIDSLGMLPAPARAVIEEELAGREFLPEIRQIVAVSSFAAPSTWTVETDRGQTSFVLRGEEFIRRLQGGNTLLISDSHGIQFLIRDLQTLDRNSRRLLDRFL